MRAVAEGFSAEHLYKGRTWNKLRMLTKPFARYGKLGSDVQDGRPVLFRPRHRPRGPPDARIAAGSGRPLECTHTSSCLMTGFAIKPLSVFQ